MVDEDEFGAAVLEDVRDLRLRQACVDRADDCAGGEDAVVRICLVRRSGVSGAACEKGRTSYERPAGASEVCVCRVSSGRRAHEFGAMTATRSPGCIPACIRAYAKFCTRCALHSRFSTRSGTANSHVRTDQTSYE